MRPSLVTHQVQPQKLLLSPLPLGKGKVRRGWRSWHSLAFFYLISPKGGLATWQAKAEHPLGDIRTGRKITVLTLNLLLGPLFYLWDPCPRRTQSLAICPRVLFTHIDSHLTQILPRRRTSNYASQQQQVREHLFIITCGIPFLPGNRWAPRCQPLLLPFT